VNVGTKQSAVAFLEPSTGIPGIFNATAAHTHTHTHTHTLSFNVLWGLSIGNCI